MPAEPDDIYPPIMRRLRDAILAPQANAMAAAMAVGETPMAAMLHINTRMAIDALAAALGAVPPAYRDRLVESVTADVRAHVERNGAQIDEVYGLLDELGDAIRSAR